MSRPFAATMLTPSIAVIPASLLLLLILGPLPSTTVAQPATSPGASPTAQVYAGGNFGDPCAVTSSETKPSVLTKCRPDLVCANAKRAFQKCLPDETECNCFSRKPGGAPTECQSSADCRSGDRCARINVDPNITECGGCLSVAEIPEWESIDDDDNCLRVADTAPTVTPVPSTTPSTSVLPSPSMSIVAMSPSPSVSVAAVSPTAAQTSSSTVPLSSSFPTPSSSPLVSATAASPSPLTSITASPSPSTSPAVCIGVHHLTTVRISDRVFQNNVLTSVLCDLRESCATPGHIVVFHGRVMRMSEYCKMTGDCVKKDMMVNSPRWRRGLRVGSHTDGLEFTALAARWETTMEEHVLRALIRLGA